MQIVLVLLLVSSIPFPTGPAAADATTELPDCDVPDLRGSTAVRIESKIYLFGGEDTAAIRRFDPDRPCVAGFNPFTLFTTLPSPREGMAGVYKDGFVYLYGGVSPTGFYHTTVLRFDPFLEDIDVIFPDGGKPRAYAAGVDAGAGGILFMGGHDLYGPRSDIFRFDTWHGYFFRLDKTLPTPRTRMASAVVDGRLYMFGGETSFAPFTQTDRILVVQPGGPTLGESGTTLPAPLSRATAVADGSRIYLIGGRTGPAPGDVTTQVLRFTVPTRALDPMCSRIRSGAEGAAGSFVSPRAWLFGTGGGREISSFTPGAGDVCPVAELAGMSLEHASFAWDGTRAWLFGVRMGVGPADRVVTFDATSDTFMLPGTTTPTPRMNATAVHDGQSYVYLFGGRSGDGNAQVRRDILRFDPTAGTFMTMGATLPEGLHLAESVWDGRNRPDHGCPDGCAYIFGGSRKHYDPWPWGESVDTILRYNPATDRLTTMGARLPVPMSAGAASFDGTYVHLFGGRTARFLNDPYVDHDTILRYDPLTDSITTAETRLDAATFRAAATWDGVQAYVLGGAGRVVIQRFNSGTYTGPPSSGPSTVVATTTLPHEVPSPRAFWDGRDKVLFHEPTAFRYDETPTNAPPAPLAVADRVVNELATLAFTVSASPDPDGDAVRLHMEPLPVGATFVDHGDRTGTFTWTPSQDFQGTHRVALVAHDDREASRTWFRIEVLNVDRPPVLGPIADQTVDEGRTLAIRVLASDADGEPITLTAPGLPLGATFTDHGDGTADLVWDAVDGDRGTYPLSVVATAGGASVAEPFVVTARPVGRPYLVSLLPREVDAAPSAWLTLDATVTNLAASTDTIAFVTGTTAGWATTTPPAVTLAPGGSANVSFAVYVPAGATSALVGLSAWSTNDPARYDGVAWTVRVPVHVTIVMDDATPGLLGPVTGRLIAEYVGGVPAAGLPAVVLQHILGRGETAGLAAYRAGVTDAAGEFAFDLSLDPRAILPGTHRLVGLVRYGELDWTGMAYYTVTVP